MTFVRPFKPNYGTGADGVLTLSGTVTKQEYNLADGSSISGLTLSNSYLPSIIRCLGTLTISGAIQGNGLGYAGGARGTTANIGYPGTGPGRGAPPQAWNQSAGGGGHAAPGGGEASINAPGYPYDGLADILKGSYDVYCAGSGGAGGISDGTQTGTYGGAGGSGAAGLILIAPTVVFGSSALMSLNGNNGEAAYRIDVTWHPCGGGGGSGGFLLVLAQNIVLPSSGTIITAVGGAGGASIASAAGGNGANGRIYLCYLNSITPSDAASRSTPVATVINLAKLPVAVG